MKVVGSCYYVHKSNRNELLQNIKDKENRSMVHCICRYYSDVDPYVRPYDVIKYDKSTNKLTLIKCPGFDSENEPIVGDGYLFDINDGRFVKEVKSRKTNPQIYHSKELFVDQKKYKGFDISKAKQRTKLWNDIPNLDKKRIGNRDYWIQLLNENGIDV